MASHFSEEPDNVIVNCSTRPGTRGNLKFEIQSFAFRGESRGTQRERERQAHLKSFVRKRRERRVASDIVRHERNRSRQLFRYECSRQSEIRGRRDVNRERVLDRWIERSSRGIKVMPQVAERTFSEHELKPPRSVIGPGTRLALTPRGPDYRLRIRRNPLRSATRNR